MLFHRDTEGDEHFESSDFLAAIALILSFHRNPDLAGQVTHRIYQCSPTLPPFPESLISRVGAEHQQQTQNDIRDQAGQDGKRHGLPEIEKKGDKQAKQTTKNGASQNGWNHRTF